MVINMLRRHILAVVGGIAAVGGYLAGRFHGGDRWGTPDYEQRYELGHADRLSVDTVPNREFELQDDGETVVLDHEPGDTYEVELDS